MFTQPQTSLGPISPHPMRFGMPARSFISVRRLGSALGALIALITTLLLSVSTAHADTSGTFTPGAAWNDTSGNTLQMHGLGIVKVGSVWYGFGENKAGESSTTAAFQSVSCYKSSDLSHWAYQAAALSRQSSGDLGPNRVVERPKVIYNS